MHPKHLLRSVRMTSLCKGWGGLGFTEMRDHLHLSSQLIKKRNHFELPFLTGLTNGFADEEEVLELLDPSPLIWYITSYDFSML